MSPLVTTWMNRAGVVAAVVLVAVLVVATRAAVAGRAELERGLALLARPGPSQAELDDAVLHLRRAASWTLPGSDVPDRALVALEDLARAAEARGETDRALHAWRSLVAGAMAGRSLLTGDVRKDPRVRRAIDAVRRLGGEAGARALEEPGLRREGVLLALGGFLGALVGAIVYLGRGYDALGRPRPGARGLRRVTGVVAALGIAVFVFGLAWA